MTNPEDRCTCCAKLRAAERVVEHIKFCAACGTSCRTLLAIADEATGAYSVVTAKPEHTNPTDLNSNDRR